MIPSETITPTPPTVIERLSRLVATKRLPHALLFVGTAQNGLQDTTLTVTRLVQCKHSPEERGTTKFVTLCDATPHSPKTCESCRLIASGSHPDVQRIDCAAISGEAPETLREVLSTSYRKPFMGGARVTVLLNAHELSTAAHNLLLKTLEEPRPENFYILTTPSQSLLPSTVLSRSQIWFFPETIQDSSALDAEEIDKLQRSISAVANGELHSAVMLATRIHKEFKDRISAVLLTLTRIGREQLLRSTTNVSTNRWARFVSDVLELEYSILTRNYNSQYQLVGVFERLARG
jgi:DNA polymerase III gamma/tau subunit